MTCPWKERALDPPAKIPSAAPPPPPPWLTLSTRGLKSGFDPGRLSHAFAYADERLELVIGLKGPALSGGRLTLEAFDLAGRPVGMQAFPLETGRQPITVFPRPVTLRLSVELNGVAPPRKAWVRLDPIACADQSPSTRLLFDPAYYLAQIPGAPPADPLAHYLAQGENEGLKPHPWFDPGAYGDVYMTPTGRKGSRLVDYASRSAREPVRPHPLFDAEWYVRAHDIPQGAAPLDDFLGRRDRAPNLAAATAGAVGTETPGRAERPERLKPVRVSYHAPSLVEDAERTRGLSPAPDLPITVIAEAEDEQAAAWIRGAISRQTHPRTSLLLVEHRHDRAAALNAALDRTQGAAIAFFDAASEWRPDHLSLMAAALGDGSVVHASWKRIEPTGRERWLGQAYDPAAHAYQDFLPLAVLLQRPARARFDPEAGPAMSWAYARALLAETGAPTWLPAVTVERRQASDPSLDARLRLISRDLPGWRAPAPASVAASLILPVQGRFTLVQETLAALIRTDAGVDHEIVLVDNGMVERDLPLAIEWTRRFNHVRLVRTPQPLRAAIGANWGALQARGRALVFVWAGPRPRPGWLKPLMDGLKASASVQPPLVSPDGAARSQGLARTPGGMAVAPTEEILVVDAAAFRAVRGFDPLMADGPMAADLALRLGDHGGFRVAEGPPTTIASERALSLAVNPTAQTTFLQRWGELIPAPRQLLGRASPEPCGPLRVALKVCFANEPEANSGDWHFARSLAAALRVEGCRVRVDGTLDWYSAAEPDDVVLVLRGRWRYAPSPRHLNLMWLISHPDQVRAREALAYDHVFVASGMLAARLAEGAAALAPERRRLVTPLLQCVDTSLFHPPERAPADRALFFVGNSRGVERPIVQAAASERLPLEIHGRQWDRFDARALVRGPGLVNPEVADLYRRGVVLNDHWSDMRAAGILSNRLFDAAACAAPVISDHIAGLDDVFHGLIGAWRPGTLLAPLIRAAASEDGRMFAERLSLAQEVMKAHSFAARAREIVAVSRRELARLAGDPTRRDAAP